MQPTDGKYTLDADGHMGDRRQPNPPPGEPGYDGPAKNFKPAPPPAPPAKRNTVGPWRIERDINDYSIVSDSGRVAGYVVSKSDARLLAAAPAMRAVLAAVFHQLTLGEASDALDIGIFGDGTQDDLRWCRKQIQKVLKSLD